MLLGASLLVGLALAEGSLRLLGLSWPVFYRPDPILGEVPIPGAEGWDRSENAVFVRFNEHGMRDRPRSLPKPPGTLRIALLGDSYVEAKQVDLEETVGAVLERELDLCPSLEGREVEVLNFGVSGYGTTQALLMFRERARKFAPDIVILGFFVGNDIRNNSLALQGASKPHFVERDGDLVLDTSFAEGIGTLLRNSALGRSWYEMTPYSRTAQLVAATLRARREREREERRREEERTAATAAGTPGFEPGLDHAIFFEPAAEPWESAWRLSEKILARLRDEVEDTGAHFLLATIGTGIQVHPDPAVRSAFARTLGVPDLEAPERRLSLIARRQAIDHLPLVPPLRRYAEVTGSCVHGFVGAVPCGGHWNSLGHRVAASALAERICTLSASRAIADPGPGSLARRPAAR
jgi:hypothetical protein